MLSQVGIPQPKDESDYSTFAIDNFYLYHLIGDPTLAIWTSKPLYLSPEHTKSFTTNSVIVEYAINGAQITALQKKQSDTVPIDDIDTVPIGRATVKDGKATIDFINEPDPDLPIFFSASMQGAVSSPLQSNPDPECEGATCETYTPCNIGGSCGDEGVCGTIYEGGGLCVNGLTSCDGLVRCPNGTSDCPSGSICFVNSCCVDNVCMPSDTFCSEPSDDIIDVAPAAEAAPAGPSFSSP